MNFRSVFKHYWPFVLKYKWAQITLMLTYALGKIIDIAIVPFIFKTIIDTVSNPPANASEVLLDLLIYLVFLFILMNIFFRLGDYFMIRFESKILEDLSNYSLKKLQNHSYNFFTNNFTGSLIAKTKRFVNSFETLQDQFIFSLWFGFISLGSSLGVLFYLNATLGFLFLGWLLSYIGLVAVLVHYKYPKV
jgi:ATP-binding cassette subfamily B protein